VVPRILPSSSQRSRRARDPANLRGSTAIVTGGTDGIGREIARQLSSDGASVVIVGRDESKADGLRRELREARGRDSIQFVKADLSLTSEVERVAEEIASRWPEIHYLVHSAGALLGSRKLTSEGVETNFAINYLARFTLTRRLLLQLTAAGHPGRSARILFVSGAARGRVNFDDVNFTSGFGTIKAVQQFCRANDLLTQELAHALEASRANVAVACLKMGVVKTGIRRNFPLWMKLLVPLIDPIFAHSPEEAADSAVKILLDPGLDEASGALFSDILSLKRLSPLTGDKVREEGLRLWKLSERLEQGKTNRRGGPIETRTK
jgi:NAD(P)-dependent dehydrogenase (short-subunit alcohol dehydrogenase family)